MKTFSSYLNEVSSMTLDQGGSAMDLDMNRGDYSDPKVIASLDLSLVLLLVTIQFLSRQLSLCVPL